MKGVTTIRFNQATMIEAMQMYCDAQLTGKHKVTKVLNVSGGSSYNSGTEFDIEITDEVEVAK